MQKLSKLFLKNLVFSGVHGSTGRETTDPQHFQIDIEMEIDIGKARESDKLSDTYDYKHAREVARAAIEDEHYVLIEKIAHEIAKRICDDSKVFFATVVLTKLHASQNGVPGITVTYKRAPQEMV
jgi:7,8-dihydroneopterin aldolase/epimerase/oxygenase